MDDRVLIWEFDDDIEALAASAAAFGVVTALVDASQYVVIDQLAHATLRQAAAAATRSVLLHRHLDAHHVRELLALVRARDTANRILVVTEGRTGMDLDSPDLPLLRHLCHEYGASLLVIGRTRRERSPHKTPAALASRACRGRLIS